MQSTLRNIARNLYDLPGWHTNRKIVVIESDDWGAIRMPNLAIKTRVNSLYSQFFDSPYYRYDTLAREKDLSSLFDVLTSYKDKNGRHPVVTANSIMVNPDFQKIKSDNFEHYSFELFTDSIRRYYDERVFNVWEEGIKSNIFYPQLHGREHVDVTRWMNALQNKQEVYLKLFDYGIYAVDDALNAKKKNLTAALDFTDTEDEYQKANTLLEACGIFYEVFGYRSASFIAPSYTWGNAVEQILQEQGIRFLQGTRSQKVPLESKNGDYLYKKHFLGQKNTLNQRYLVRNVFFEPALHKENYEVIGDVINRIKWSFAFKRPAIISSHRLNFIGALDEKNRDRNLKLLSILIKKIISKWSDVEFMTSDELGMLID